MLANLHRLSIDRIVGKADKDLGLTLTNILNGPSVASRNLVLGKRPPAQYFECKLVLALFFGDVVSIC